MAVSITPAESGLSKVAVLGAGLVGTRVVRELAVGGVRPLTLVTRRQQRVAELRPVAGRNTRIVFEADFASAIDSLDDSTCTVILASEPGGQSELATKCLQRGFHVITCLDEPNVTSELLSLNSLAEANDRRLVVGSAFSPGLTCLLAKWATRHLERVTEIHLATVGAGGPECARQRLRAARGTTMEWRDGSWVPAGSMSPYTTPPAPC